MALAVVHGENNRIGARRGVGMHGSYAGCGRAVGKVPRERQRVAVGVR